MPVTFHIPSALREFTAGQSKVEIEHSSTTLADALSALWTLYPGVRDRIATEQGQVREHINIFIGDCTALITVPKTGWALPTECRRILVSP